MVTMKPQRDCDDRRSSLWRNPLDQGFEFLTGMKGHYPTGRNRDFFASFGVSTWPLRLVAQLEIAETRQLDAVATLERTSNFIEKRLNHILGLTLVQTDPIEKHLGQLSLGQCEALGKHRPIDISKHLVRVVGCHAGV
jgi:hypothetical protein